MAAVLNTEDETALDKAESIMANTKMALLYNSGFSDVIHYSVNFLLKSEPQRIRTSTGMFLFDSSYAVFRDFLLIIYLDTISEKAENRNLIGKNE